MNNYYEYIEAVKDCKDCRMNKKSLIHDSAFPLFMEKAPFSFDILFIMEAPNYQDTINPAKGFLTVNNETDPTGRFLYELFIESLGLDIRNLFLTNSVLCLPALIGGKYPVSSEQKYKCKENLKKIIQDFDPLIVCPLGLQALKATQLIEDHNLSKMSDAVAVEKKWFNRILFPLYHTSSQARSSRSVEEQKCDWAKLRKVFERVKAT